MSSSESAHDQLYRLIFDEILRRCSRPVDTDLEDLCSQIFGENTEDFTVIDGITWPDGVNLRGALKYANQHATKEDLDTMQIDNHDRAQTVKENVISLLSIAALASYRRDLHGSVDRFAKWCADDSLKKGEPLSEPEKLYDDDFLLQAAGTVLALFKPEMVSVMPPVIVNAFIEDQEAAAKSYEEASTNGASLEIESISVSTE